MTISKLEDDNLDLYFLNLVDAKTFERLSAVTLTAEEKKSAVAMCEKFEGAIYPPGETQALKAELMTLTQKSGENAKDFGFRIGELATRAYPLANLAPIRDEMSRNAFIQGLHNTDLRLKVQENDGAEGTFYQLVSLANKFEKIRLACNASGAKEESLYAASGASGMHTQAQPAFAHYNQAQPTFAQSSQAQPAFAQSNQAEPSFAQSSQAQPAYAQSNQAQPTFAQSSEAQLAYAQSIQAQPVFAQSNRTQPTFQRPTSSQYSQSQPRRYDNGGRGLNRPTVNHSSWPRIPLNQQPAQGASGSGGYRQNYPRGRYSQRGACHHCSSHNHYWRDCDQYKRDHNMQNFHTRVRGQYNPVNLNRGGAGQRGNPSRQY